MRSPSTWGVALVAVTLPPGCFVPLRPPPTLEERRAEHLPEPREPLALDAERSRTFHAWERDRARMVAARPADDRGQAECWSTAGRAPQALCWWRQAVIAGLPICASLEVARCVDGQPVCRGGGPSSCVSRVETAGASAGEPLQVVDAVERDADAGRETARGEEEAAPQVDVEARMQIAQGLYGATQYASAVSAAEAILEVAPEHSDAWAVLGAARVHLGDLQGAADAMGRAVALVPEARSYRQMLQRIDHIAQEVRDGEPRWRSTELLRWTVGRGRAASWSMRQAQERDDGWSAGHTVLVGAVVVVGVALVMIATGLEFDASGKSWW